MKKAFILVLVACFFAVGCTGSFNLTRKVYDFHRSQEDKWADELMFLVVVFVPIYSFSTLADAIVFNSIEFWTGENPVTAKNGSSMKVVGRGNDKATISYNPATDEVTIQTLTQAGQETLIMERSSSNVTAKDLEGNVLYTSQRNENGDILVYNAEGQLVKNFSAEEVADIKGVYVQ